MRWLRNPVGTWALFFAGALAALALSRAGLLAWQWDRVQDTGNLHRVFTLGLRLDLALLCYLAGAPLLLHVLLPRSHLRTWLAPILLTALGTLLLFMEAATPEFMGEYDNRPDRLFFEYLEHPREVFGMLWAHHRAVVVLIPAIVALLAWAQWRAWRRWLPQECQWNWRRSVTAAAVLIVALFVGARGVDHRPLNLSDAAFSANRLANELVPNSTYTLVYAAYSRRHEMDDHLYGRMPWDEVLERVRRYMHVPPQDFTQAALPTLHRTQVEPRSGPKLNLVIMLQESLGAPFVGHLGGLPLTPNLDRLAEQGWTFERLYATGTRTARGMEAVATGFPPTPAPAVLKLPRAQRDFFTLAALLKRNGYTSEFVYGGVANFDNMRGFYLANGFDRVIEQKDFANPVFRGSWGVSDEDWVAKAHETFLAHGDQPFFALMMSTSNHDPFEYPLGRIEPYERPDFTRHNAMKYADHAIGKFFELARTAPYFERTIFVVVADHDARVYGADFVPVEHFRIPGVIVGPGVPVRREARLASQLDLGPTLLHLLGIPDAHPMIGRDLLALPEREPGLALMQFDDQHGFRYGDRMVVHQPGQPALHFQVGPNDALTRAPPDPELERDALAHALWPAEAYNRGLYRLPAEEAAPRSDQGSR
jgi:phosphoglycerol transferase MdoB-like AlkP superfamily enzyme